MLGRVFVVACVCLCACALGQTTTPPPTAPKISAPDVDPLSGTFEESVHVVMVQNAQQAQIYYSLDPDAVINVNSSRYTRPFYIYTVGVVYLRAVAISDLPGRPDSEMTSRRYTIKEGVRRLPVISPAASTYRGSVNVTIDSDGPVEFRTDMDDHFTRFTKPFLLDVSGHHSVFARRIPSEGKDAASETTVTAVYTITPPLRYDVSSTCEDCGNKPTRCVPFTVWIQGLTRPGRLFLTTGQLGCERRTHVLVDTNEVNVDTATAGYRFTTADDPSDVFVCLQEREDGPYRPVPRRTAGPSFRLNEAPASRACQTLPPTTPAPRATMPIGGDATYTNEAEASSFMSMGNVFFWTLVVAAAFLIMRAHRQRMSNSQDWTRAPARRTAMPDN